MHTTGQPSLTTVQQCVVNALAAVSTLTDAAETYGVHRVTIYRWMKTRPEFCAALRSARAEFVLARRDDLHRLSKRALETVLSVLDNPKASPAVLLRTAMFVLQRPEAPKTGWSLPEPVPEPGPDQLLDSVAAEQDCGRLPALCNLDRDDPTAADAPAEASNSIESPAGSPAPEPPPPPDATGCNPMQHEFENSAGEAPAVLQPELRSCPAPPVVLQARHNHALYLEAIDLLRSVELTPLPEASAEDLPAGAEDPA